MDKFSLKTEEEIKIMAEGGKKLGQIKKELAAMVKEGVSSMDVEEKAVELIGGSGGEASFKKVPNYDWATCVNVNAGLVHGIPSKEVIFKKGDLVSIDVGLFYKGFHTDASVSVGVGLDVKNQKFLETGKEALKAALNEAKPGNRIFDLSMAIQDTIVKAGFTPIQALVGHGVGKNLHEEPAIPCFVSGPRLKSLEIVPGMALAIEVMYTQGRPEIKIEEDGWTISVRDDKISALFEETVAVTRHGPLVLTEG
jgi:methionyl aminopeptidase